MTQPAIGFLRDYFLFYPHKLHGCSFTKNFVNGTIAGETHQGCRQQKKYYFFYGHRPYLSKIESGKSEGNIKYDAETFASTGISVLTQSSRSGETKKRGKKNASRSKFGTGSPFLPPEVRLQPAIKRFGEIFELLNKINGIKINALVGGTNIYKMSLPDGTNVQKLADHPEAKHFMRINSRADANGNIKITVNETLLYRDVKYVVDAFKDGIKTAGG